MAGAGRVQTGGAESLQGLDFAQLGLFVVDLTSIY